MKILAIDQSLSAMAGVLLESDDKNRLNIADTFVSETKLTGIYRINEHRSALEAWFAYQPDLIVREMHNMRQHGAASALHQLSGVIDLLVHDNAFLSKDNYAIISPPTWKKLISGSGRLAKDTAYLLKLNKSLTKCKYINFTQQINDDNIVDAICLGVTGYLCWNIKHESCDFIEDDDVDFLTKSIPKMFDYGKSK